MFDDKVPVLYYAVRSHSDEKVKIMLESGATWNQLSQEQLNDALIGASCDGSRYRDKTWGERAESLPYRGVDRTRNRKVS